MTRRDLEGASIDEPLPYGSGPAQRQLVEEIRAEVADESQSQDVGPPRSDAA